LSLSLFNGALRLHRFHSVEWMIVSYELGWMWKEAPMAYFIIPSQHLPAVIKIFDE